MWGIEALRKITPIAHKRNSVALLVSRRLLTESLERLSVKFFRVLKRHFPKPML